MGNAERDELCSRVFDSLLAALGPAEVVQANGVTTLFRRFVARAHARRLLAEWGLPLPRGAGLFRLEPLEQRLEDVRAANAELEAALARSWELGAPPAPRPPELLGARFEALLGYRIERAKGVFVLCPARNRKRTGSFYTPDALSRSVASQALERVAALGRLDAPDFAICDPACGAGAFLLEVARQLHARRAAQRESGAFDSAGEWRRILASLCGVDVDPVALDVAQIVLYAAARDPTLEASDLGRLRRGDALGGRGFGADSEPRARAAVDFNAAFPEVASRGFDLVIGNPPWIAYAGRSAQPLEPARRRALRQNYEGFRGYPTLHGAFVERACRLAPRGVVALLLPSPLADLDGYRPLRRALLRTHAPCEPMLEFGQDAFAEVTQPCFALVARPLDPAEVLAEPLERRFRLLERARQNGVARALSEPEALARLGLGEPFPPELFGEMGFQTTRAVSERLLRRADAPDAVHTYPLLEGRVVSEFVVGRPALFLRPDPELLKRERCRLRPLEDYRRARFVVRQTAKIPIAALHASGLPFRNTLLAGFFSEQWPPDFLVGLLNSSLYRAFHVARQRDARQAAFPQVKISHLRALPRPPVDADQVRVRELVACATQGGPSPELRRSLDDAVFDLFGLEAADRESIRGFVRARVPELEKNDV
jgi:hypothetical protein